MVNEDNQYTKMQKQQYANGTSNHPEHNSNDDYWNILLGDIKNKDAWKDKVGLDFGCGKGRNVTNLIKMADWKRVDGVDISEGNIHFCSGEYRKQNSKWYVNNGIDLCDLKSNEYDFVMSTITLQHIPVYDIRDSILKDIFRVLKSKGILSFQMTYGSTEERRSPASYYDNIYNAPGTNSILDVRISNEKDVIDHLTSIGFENITIEIRDSFSDSQHPKWIYIRCEKG